MIDYFELSRETIRDFRNNSIGYCNQCGSKNKDLDKWKTRRCEKCGSDSAYGINVLISLGFVEVP